MTALRLFVPLIALITIMTHAQSQVVAITEPGTYEISDLFKRADVVALVKIVSGNTESYDHAVYKGEVIQSFKRMHSGATVYFGPFIGEKLGWEYLLFLRNVTKPITPKQRQLTAMEGFRIQRFSMKAIPRWKLPTSVCLIGKSPPRNATTASESVRTTSRSQNR
jgi:hypothetical protein